MNSTRLRKAAVVFGAAILLSASPAAGSPGNDDGSGGRIALNGTQMSGVHDSDGRIAVNGTALTGVRSR